MPKFPKIPKTPTPESEPEQTNGTSQSEATDLHNREPVSGMYQNWFLDYASYVILDRAVPALDDGLKPVQRRLLHTLKEMDDGRFHKAANIIGQTMKYHPHGDASIYEALVNLAQKGFLIDTQGNWGDPATGDSAAAPRYIEAKLSRFAHEILFNEETTHWQSSYDGRNREPVTLPVKFPLLLLYGIEGIAVGLATKVMPHNFCELVQASIDYLKRKKVNLVPDFPSGGIADFSNYNEGKREGKIRIRAKMEVIDKKTLVIKEIPYTTTTASLMDSIVQANDKGKIKIRKVDDNTAKNVEIFIHLSPGTSPDITMDALYAFTNCEVSISPNACVIENGRPVFLSVNDILKKSTDNTVKLLGRELENWKAKLEEKWHMSSLEKIFIEKRIYRNIEECETFEAVIETIFKGLKPYQKQFRREITREDILKLTEIKIKRISKYDSFKANEEIRSMEEEMKQVNFHIANLTEYAIQYFTSLLNKYSKGNERKTEIRMFDTISAVEVAVANQKLYVNREEGFIGTSLRQFEYVCDCSDMDEIIAFRKDGKMMVTKAAEKTFVGKDILLVNVFKKNDERTIYNMIYQDGPKGKGFAKRFAVSGVIRDKEYDLTKGTPDSTVHYLSQNPNGESEVVTLNLRHQLHMKKPSFDFDFKELMIKGRSSIGNTITKYIIRKVTLKEKGVSTLGGLDIWYDEILMRLNTDSRGHYLGNFSGEDKVLVINKNGTWEMKTFELTNHFDEGTLIVRKYKPGLIISAVHFEGDKKRCLVKRFEAEDTAVGRKVLFISETEGSKLWVASVDEKPIVTVKFVKGKRVTPKPVQEDLSAMIEVKGYKAAGNIFTKNEVAEIKLISNPEVTQGVTAPVQSQLLFEPFVKTQTGAGKGEGGKERKGEREKGRKGEKEKVKNWEKQVERKAEKKETGKKSKQEAIKTGNKKEETKPAVSKKPKKDIPFEIIDSRKGKQRIIEF